MGMRFEEQLIKDYNLNLFLEPYVVIILLAFYLVSKPIFKLIKEGLAIQPKGTLFRLFMVCHNAALCIFSGWVSYNVWPMTYNYISENGIRALHESPTFWNEAGFSSWAIIFYVSKYYEFLDSWILVLKGDNPSFLQVYHHTGIVIAMYFGCIYQSNWLLFVVTLNSFIHTLMYFYYCFSVCGYKSPLASTLTTMQLTQFVVGIILASYSFICDVSIESKLTLGYLDIYAIGLIYLFSLMYKEKYKKGKGAAKKN